MSINLHVSSHIHDTFLHVSPSLYKKVYNQLAPLIKLNFDENLVFWCVEDASIRDETAQINSKFAENLGLKNGSQHNISIGIFKHTNLSKVMVSLPNGSEDWKLLYQDFESLQSLILNQIRLVKRGNLFPIYSKSRNTPLWIKVEEFDGYKSPEKLGVISNDTELVFIDSISEPSPNVSSFVHSFIVVPTFGFEFHCNSAHGTPDICRFKDHQFIVRKCETVPQGVLLVPDIILKDVFKICSKEKIEICSSISEIPEFFSTINYSADGGICIFESSNHLIETIISTPTGIVVKSSNSEPNVIIPLNTEKSFESNSFSEFISKTEHRIIIFNGQSGCGKSKAIGDAIQYLNHSSSYLFNMIYFDLLETNNLSFSDIEDFSVIILDHVDEYLLVESDSDDEVTKKYIRLCRDISDLVSMYKMVKFVIVTRSNKDFTQFLPKFPLRFDYSYSLQKFEGWTFDINLQPFEDVLGLVEAKLSLQRLILNPLKFYSVYKANNMDLHSSILLSGPSGSGKTYLALKFLNHHKIPFIHVHGPEILNKYVGSSEKGVRDIFIRARKIKPCVILFDEFDSLVPKRGSNQSGVTDRIVNQFLTELDGTEDRSGVFIIATTSRPDLMDKAIIRPGRIDNRIELSYPNSAEIKEFLSRMGLSSKKTKAVVRILGSSQNLTLSWADLKSVDWEDPLIGLSSLLKLISSKETSPCISNLDSSSQRLTLA